MLKHCAANGKRRLSALPNVSPYIYDVKFLALQGAPYIYDISRLRVNGHTQYEHKFENAALLQFTFGSDFAASFTVIS
jgi:hypothetical protein